MIGLGDINEIVDQKEWIPAFILEKRKRDIGESMDAVFKTIRVGKGTPKRIALKKEESESESESDMDVD